MISFAASKSNNPAVKFAREAFAPPVADWIDDVPLAADTLARVAIPPGARFATLSFNGDFRAKLGVLTTTYALPSAVTSNGSGALMSPAQFMIPATIKVSDADVVPTHIILRARAACEGSISFYS